MLIQVIKSTESQSLLNLSLIPINLSLTFQSCPYPGCVARLAKVFQWNEIGTFNDVFTYSLTHIGQLYHDLFPTNTCSWWIYKITIKTR